MRGGSRVIIEPHRHEGVFIARGKEDALVTKNLVPGETVYGEKKISVDVSGWKSCMHLDFGHRPFFFFHEYIEKSAGESSLAGLYL